MLLLSLSSVTSHYSDMSTEIAIRELTERLGLNQFDS